MAILREHKAKQSAERLRIGSLWRGSDDSVFTTEFGAQIHPDTPTGLFTRLRPLLGQLPKDQRPTFHSFRHTHATTLLLSGTPPHVVAHRLGHRDANVTLAIYAHLLPGYDVQAAELFDAEMDKPVEGEATDEDQISKSS